MYAYNKKDIIMETYYFGSPDVLFGDFKIVIRVRRRYLSFGCFLELYMIIICKLIVDKSPLKGLLEFPQTAIKK